jgi:NADH oxidase (H2O2-forming)
VAGLATPDSIVVPDKKLEAAGINVCVAEVTKIDAETKKVAVSNGSEFDYDKLFLATGSSSFIPPIEGNDLGGVMALRGLDDAGKITDFIKDNAPKKLVFIGAGFISMEIASLIAGTNPGLYDITVVELFNRPLPLMLDKDMADSVEEYLEEKGIKMLTNEKVEKILGSEGNVTGVELGSGKKLDADMVFINVGVRPNTDLAENIGLEMGTFGIKVNPFQETSDPNILAGGDCVEKNNLITKKPDPGRLRGPAVMQGRLAAKRLAGYEIEFPGVLNAGGCQMFDLVVTATGFTEEAAAKEGFETVCAMVESRSKHGMIPGVKPWKIKLVFDKKTQKLIGGQTVSHAVSPARQIDAVTAFIMGEKTISDLTTFMSACNPDISSEPSLEPITIAAEQALQKLKAT